MFFSREVVPLHAKNGKIECWRSGAGLHAPDSQWIIDIAESSPSRREAGGAGTVPELLLTVLPRARESLETGHRQIQNIKHGSLGRARGKRTHGEGI